MGKGGEKSTKAAVAGTYKLEKMETEELRKWAKAYGVNAKEDDRETLLKELVSSRQHLISVAC
jgi:hypothetical protein